ncbi:lysosome-associated membrane glycoprotein 1-like [Salarias fasciatus]|uniref:Lysosome-associated membrane glycoprotein 1 n=1 Tax=Salarias fasciatus TaxID=181472 RepID=A0A672IUF6_SALFA|nr:lysosome-associated membrane glycoprotein 1-like [Salarias fasciatus]
MTRLASARPWSLGVALPLLFAAALHQGFATVAPPTTAQTTAAPHKGPERPERGQYHVSGSNGTVCLLAYMGLQLNITVNLGSQNKSVQDVMNINPNLTKSSGSCEPDRAVLQLNTDSDRTNLSFVFVLNTTSNKYHLGEVSVTAAVPDMTEPFSARNVSLDYLHGNLGHSYMCRQEQRLAVTSGFSVNAFQMQVQPFGVVENQFGAAEECQLDEDDMLIPIIVGGALAGLVLVVLLAYLIGRKRSHAGYQTI